MTSPISSKKLKKADSTHPESKTQDFNEKTLQYLEDIDNCQTDLEALNEQASEEIIKVEQKFNKLREPHLQRRSELIQQVPNFWSKCFTNHSDLSNLIRSDGEKSCFNHLQTVDVKEADDIKSGYQILFYFNDNPYFLNNLLVKQYHVGENGKPTSTSTAIEWKEGMNLLLNPCNTDVSLARKRKHHNTSFFEWFNDHFDPTSDRIAEIIKDDLWQTPLQYFLNSDTETNGLDEENESTAEDDEEAVTAPVDNQSVSAPVDSVD